MSDVTQADLERVGEHIAVLERFANEIPDATVATHATVATRDALRRVLAAAQRWCDFELAKKITDSHLIGYKPAVAAEPTTEPEYKHVPFRKVGTVTGEVKPEGEQSGPFPTPASCPTSGDSPVIGDADLDRLESVRDELRQAFFDCFFWGITAHGIEGHAEEVQTAKGGVFILIQFGTRSKLISPEEGNDWLDVLGEKQTLGDVSEKWMKEAHNV